MSELPIQVYIVLITLLLAGVAFAWMGFRRLFNRKPILGGSNLLLGLLLIATVFASVGLISNFYTYARLTHEQWAAKISFVEYEHQHYIATLHIDGTRDREYHIYGDECQVSARILKWKAGAILFGFETLSRLERLSGRYKNTIEDESARRSVYPLAEEAGIELWDMVSRFDKWLPWVDVVYGGAVYFPMREGAEYGISVTTSGLVARPHNKQAEIAMKEWR